MKIIVVGATGTIGAAVAKALAANKHEVVAASRNGAVKVNLDEPASIRAMFDTVRDVDAVISCAGNAVFKPFADLTDADYELCLRSKLMGQVALARTAKDQLRDGGSITVTTGVLAMRPMPGSAAHLAGQCRPRRFCPRRGAGNAAAAAHQRRQSPVGERNAGEIAHGPGAGPGGGRRRQGLRRRRRGRGSGQDSRAGETGWIICSPDAVQ